MEKESSLSFLKYANYKNFYLVEPSAWAGHITFAHMLIAEYKPSLLVELGTQGGNSFFSFCQSVRQHKLSTKCIAIDCWEGDLQTGSYDDSIYESVKRYRDTHYAEFAELKKMMFDEALNDFKDASIDILHIDGYHTYEAVEHDFHAWLPKVKPGGIILFHDVNEYQETFGAYHLWNEIEPLSESTHLFRHSHGLGVWRKPGGQPLFSEVLRHLLDKESEEAFLIDSFLTAISDREFGEYQQQKMHTIIKDNNASIDSIKVEHAGDIAILKEQLNEYHLLVQRKDAECADSVAILKEQLNKYHLLVQRKDAECADSVAILKEQLNEYHLLVQQRDIALQRMAFLVAKKLQAAAEKHRNTLDTLLQSRSWKVTKPLRFIANKLRFFRLKYFNPSGK